MQGQVEGAQAIARHGVRSTLQDDRTWLELVYAQVHHTLEEVGVRIIIHSVSERHVHCIALRGVLADIPHTSGSGEIITVFVEGHGHYAVCEVEGFFYAIAVVNVNVNVHYTRKYPECEYNKIDFIHQRVID